MYREHFGLTESPFSIAPDPRYLYLSDAHREALAHLLYGIRGDGGFVLLTGEVGTGKTTICRCLLEQLPREVQAALVLNPALTVPELLAAICDDLGAEYPEGNTSNKLFIDALNRFLLDSHARGLTTVLIVDEAQNLSAEVLEQLRLLTNLETSSRKLLQIILIGQPELRDMLARNDMRQIAQRVTARYHLGPLDHPAVHAYLRHRLAVAGVHRPLFSNSAVRLLHRHSRGIPRLLNVIADRALLGGYTLGKALVDGRVVRRAAAEVLDGQKPFGRMPLLAGTAAMFALLAALALVPSIDFPPGRKSDAVAEKDAGESIAAPDIAAWKGSIEEGGGERESAEEVLLSLWNAGSYQGDLCADAGGADLACLSGTGSLSLLRRLDRPALLELQDSSGRPAYVTLVGFEGEMAQVSLDGRITRLPADTLIWNWLGRFTLLWRPPLPSTTTLGRGASGNAVAWLQGVLSSGDSEGGGGSSDTFDAILERQVKHFQLRHGLLPDGIAGPQTMILLNRQLGTPGPRLTPTRPAGEV